MKKIIIASLISLSAASSAHMIEGTPVLKGAIKTKIYVNNIKTNCRVKVEKVKNLMLEDSFGNPAYNVRLSISLSGNDFERSLSVKFDREVWINNLFTVGNGTEVRDFEYASTDGINLKIDRHGRIKTVSFPYAGKIITCSF
ncbi:MAG: hypothetical protein ACLGHN_04375 [Bacteriovoracia bacterium]